MTGITTAPAPAADNTAQELDSFVAAFTAGIDSETPTPDQVAEQTPSTEGTAPSPENTQEPAATTPEPEPEKTTEPAETSEQKAEKLTNVFEKSDKAFAEQRVKIKEYDSLVSEIAALANVEGKNPTEALNWLKGELHRIKSQNGKINDATLAEIGKAKEIISEKTVAEIKTAARTGFESLRTIHGLDDKALLDFAAQLEAKGINPFQQKVDVLDQYRLLNYDSLIAKAVEQGKQEELQRRAKAQTQSSVPQTRQGATSGTGESINTVDALRNFLDSK